MNSSPSSVSSSSSSCSSRANGRHEQRQAAGAVEHRGDIFLAREVVGLFVGPSMRRSAGMPITGRFEGMKHVSRPAVKLYEDTVRPGASFA